MRPARRLPRLLATLLLLAPSVLAAQRGGGGPQRPPINPADDPLLRGFRWRVIGPIQQGGRVDDIAVVESNPSTYYIGFATAGLWKTDNNGTTFQPIFDSYGTHSVGDVAIAQSQPNVLYVGTGEANNRQSSSFGDGVYKSTDAGRTFTHVGLRETQSISRIVVHPTNPDVVWVAANGHLFGANPDRGVFKSTNGGRTWTKTLFVDDNTGATDLVIDPSNPDVLIAATYQRRRTSWGFAGSGPGSGIWKSENGGQNWTRITGNGLPNGTMGRIGLDFSRSNPNVIYAQIEVGPDKEARVLASEPAPGQGGGRGGGAGGGAPGGGGGGGGGGGRGGQDQPPDPQVSGIWRSNDKGRSWAFASNQNNRPMYYSQIRIDPRDENVVYVGGSNPMKSTDGAKTFQPLTGMGHVDNHAIWINPNNSRHVMYGNDGSIDVSWDAGENWESLRTWEAAQSYHVSVDMRRPYYVCTGLQDNGSWCGPSRVRGGQGVPLPQDWYRIGGGDGFYSAVDPTDYTTVYSESQNGNMNRLNLRTGQSESIRPNAGGRGGRGGGGGGGRGAAGGDPGAGPEQGRGGGPQSNIVPTPPAGTQFRWNWSTPFMLSHHDPSTIYAGANRLFISRNRGETWTMTDDQTKQVDRDTRPIMGIAGNLPNCGRGRVGPCISSKHDGTSNFGNIITIAESPVVRGVLWVGTDDGNVQLSRDQGATWTEVGKNITGGTKEYYVSRVEASYFDAGTAYVSLDGHRSNDLKPYIYVTRDYGKTWTSISSNLPAFGNVNVVKQDLRNPNLLYAGTEFAFFVSLDEGKSWKKFMTDLPVVRIDDVVVHPRDHDLVLGTHGRSVQIIDDISPLQQLTPAVLAQDVHLFEPRNAVQWRNDIRNSRAVTGNKNWRAVTGPPGGTAISYYLKAPASGEVRITITNLANGQVFRNLTGTNQQGLNRVQWNLAGNPPAGAQGDQPGGGGGGGGGGRGGGGGGGPQALPGAYRITLTVNGRDYSRTVLVEEDVWMDQR
jgi:photosystem II stability/assembly factor-like uncharacterized protein